MSKMYKTKFERLFDIPSTKYDLLFLFLSALIGFIGLSSSQPEHSRLIFLIPVFWCMASKRYIAFLTVFLYKSFASRGLIPGAAIFFSECHTLFHAICLWLLMNVGYSFPFLVFWSKNPSRKALCFLAAFLVTYVLPPISIIGAINPVIIGAASLLPPGSGFWGIGIALLLIMYCCFSRKIASVSLCVIFFSAFSPLAFAPAPADFYPINTSFGRLASGSIDFSSDFERARMVFDDLRARRIRDLEQRFIVLPETIAGRMNETGIRLWKMELDAIMRDDQVVFWGGEIPTSLTKYDNVLFMYDGNELSYSAQRIPVPYSMYRPFTNTGANLHYFADGILPLPDGRSAAILICYEGFLTWPILLSMLHNPDVIIAPSNFWWCRDTSIPISHERYVSLLGRLFGIPVVFAVNK